MVCLAGQVGMVYLARGVGTAVSMVTTWHTSLSLPVLVWYQEV